MDVKKNRLAQDIDIDNNPVNKDNDIIPEDKDIKEETPTTPTPIITEEEIKPIEQNNIIEEIPQPTPEPPRPAVKNNIKYIDGGFPF
jgi:hypothetical protein